MKKQELLKILIKEVENLIEKISSSDFQNAVVNLVYKNPDDNYLKCIAELDDGNFISGINTCSFSKDEMEVLLFRKYKEPEKVYLKYTWLDMDDEQLVMEFVKEEIKCIDEDRLINIDDKTFVDSDEKWDAANGVREGVRKLIGDALNL